MVTTRAERRLAAIMAADVVGYSRLMETDEAATLDALKTLRAAVIDPLLSEHKGRIVKLMGDGALVEFQSVVDAVTCAVAIQSKVAAHEVDAHAERRLVFRIGINLGDVVVESDDLFGDGVNVAARLEQLCPPGGVLISGTAYDHMKGKLSLPIDFAGEQKVKNIAEPVRTYSVRMAGVKRGWILRTRRIRHLLMMATAAFVLLALAVAGAWWLRPVDSAVAKASIAVLPFTNIGGEESTGRLADGITEDIITDLARFPEFEVVARHSVETYKGKALDIREAGRALNVGYVLEGSIQRQEGRVRITAQLLDAASGTHLWSEQWDRQAEDVFAVQTEIAELVTNRLGGGTGLVVGAERSLARRKRPENLTAYELYLLGGEKIEQLTSESVGESVRLLTRAVELDPGLARAWVELYHAHSLSSSFGIEDVETAKKAGMDAASRAVALDPGDAEAHSVLGSALAERGEFALAKASFDTSLRLAPNAFEILMFYAGWAASLGEPERGAEMGDRAIRLNPNYPVWAAGILSWTYFAAGRNADALQMLDRLRPENYGESRWVVRAGALASLGRTAEAKMAMRQALERFPGLTIEGFVYRDNGSGDLRLHLIETMRLAGFPSCAQSPADLSDGSGRLPECMVDRKEQN
ncbi:adenylate/guanylate cyclase domain-containing protein [Mesorhizobium sp. LjNodule214]|uniref:adenylate/guanylate cyclase domain-containing protein n=1 Tax=Mesorhizobium sp. LjNodule214 TaxID=3342252 RepID=UPI003F503926